MNLWLSGIRTILPRQLSLSISEEKGRIWDNCWGWRSGLRSVWMWGKAQNFQNLPPSLSPFTYQSVFTPAAPQSLQGKGWREDGRSLLPSIPGTSLVWRLPVTQDRPVELLLGGLGWGGERVPGLQGWRAPSRHLPVGTREKELTLGDSGALPHCEADACQYFSASFSLHLKLTFSKPEKLGNNFEKYESAF